MQTNNAPDQDSVKVAVADMDKASFKMIEGKECKEQLEVKKKALQAADAAKNELRNSNSILNGNLGDLKNALANAEANAADYKKVAKNEKARNLRTGFFGFVAGGLTTLVLFLTIR